MPPKPACPARIGSACPGTPCSKNPRRCRVLLSAVVSGSGLTLSEFARPGNTIEFFLAAPGPVNGLAQGTGTTQRFRFVAPRPPGVSAARRLTATATDGPGNTSEFCGLAVAVTPAIGKRAFTVGETPIADASDVPKGALRKFLIYVNGQGGQINDVSIDDTLEPGPRLPVQGRHAPRRKKQRSSPWRRKAPRAATLSTGMS